MSNFLLIDERIKSVQEIIDALNTDTQYALGINRINALFINYTVLEKIDPNFKG